MTRPEAYGEQPLALWYHELRDRLQGRHARANARRGRLRPPAGRGKVVWLQAGGRPDSVLLGAELLAALRERRQDIRLVLTFEEEYPELIKPRLRGGKIGLGYGPCDAARAVQRTLERLQPLGVLCVGRPPARHLISLAQAREVHLVAFDTVPPPNADVTAAPIEAAYPSNAAQAEAWVGRAGYVAPTADALTILTPAQVEPNFGALMRGSQALALVWVHGSLAHVQRTLAAWHTSPLHARSVVFASLDAGAWPEAPPGLSAWNRKAVGGGGVFYVDAPRWLPAVAASADAAYLEAPERIPLWHALAGAAPLMLAGGAPAAAARIGLTLPEGQPEQFLAELEVWLETPQNGRPLADACRRAFWQARRRATQVTEELLQRVYDW